MIKLGDLELQVVSGGLMHLDGGTMFGPVPKALWQKKHPADERNRIDLETNCLLVRSASSTVLIDTGYGHKCTDKERSFYGLQSGNPIVENLAAIGVQPAEIGTVILSHLHFDHAGGGTLRDAEGRLRPTFPNARYLIQKQEWEDATSNAPELEDSYFENDLLPLKEAGQLELVMDAAVAPDISVRTTGGHTRGHQLAIMESQGQRAIFLGDLCPTAVHLRTFWTMGYDLFPLEVRRVKPKILGEIADECTLALFCHDPKIRAAYLARDEKAEFVIREAVVA